MRKLLLFVALLSVFCFGIENVSYSTFYSDSGLIEAIDFENDKDSTEAFGTRIIDTLTKSYVSWSALNSGDSTVSRINVDTIGGSPYVEGILTCDTIRGNPDIDSVVVGIIDLNGGAIDNTTIGSNTASTGDFTTLTADSTSVSDGFFKIENAFKSVLINGPGDNTVVFSITTNSKSLYTQSGLGAFFNISNASDVDFEVRGGVNKLIFADASVDTVGVNGGFSALTVNTGQGANELYGMDQGVKTTDTVTFDTLTITNGLKVGSFSVESANYDTITVANGISSANLNTDQVVTDSIQINGGTFLDIYVEGKFYATYNGFASTAQDTIRYTVIGDIVTLVFDETNFSVSNTATFTIDTVNVPSILYPSNERNAVGCCAENDAVENAGFFAKIEPAGGALFAQLGVLGGDGGYSLSTWTNSEAKNFADDNALITYKK